MSIESLFTPFQCKGLTLRNRFVMAPMTRTFSPDGIPSDDVAGYYQRRALADVGLILTEGTVINRPASKNHKDIPNFYGEEALAGWKNVIRKVHEANGKIAPQIWHVGNIPSEEYTPGSPYEGPDNMTSEDIEKTIQAYADAARSARDLGFDAFEIHGAHQYLIDQFFWDQTNHRSDDYGGKTLRERSRFAIDV